MWRNSMDVSSHSWESHFVTISGTVTTNIHPFAMLVAQAEPDYTSGVSLSRFIAVM
jgi:hypothetical protein